MLNRLPLLCALVFLAVFPASRGAIPAVSGTAPVFLTGTGLGASNPYYDQTPFNETLVGKTVVVPIVVSGSGPMTYSVTSSTPKLSTVIKTGYPVMNIHVTYSGTTSISGTTLYSFTGGDDGSGPYSAVIEASDGQLYGTTTGGTNNFGTIYQLSVSGSINPLYTFTGGADGARPYGGLIQAKDTNFYGATTAGASGFGTIYQLITSGTAPVVNTLHTFTGGDDGANPYATLVQGDDGNLYGTTESGGANGAGTVFSITTSGSLTTLYSFSGGNDGANPYAGVIQDSDGAFYGATSKGGSAGAGTVFQLVTSGSTPLFKTIYTFTGGADGANPYGGVTQGGTGILYGTTVAGGASSAGTVYEMSLSGTTATIGALTTLYSFTGAADGGSPYAPVLAGTNGNLYGTTETDGTNSGGTVFQLTTSGTLTTLHSFTAGSDGANPHAGLASGGGNIYYGTATADGAHGDGVVFEVTADYAAPFGGTMEFALLRDMAPVTAGYIAGFAEAGYYNNDQFFRITNLSDTAEMVNIAQGGDPTETGTGSVGFEFDNEFNPSLIFWGQGQLAMANAGDDTSTFRGTNGAQFFITQGPLRSLDFGYTIFGQLLQGFDVMAKVMSVPVGSDGSSPTIPVVMDSVTVSEDNTDAILLISGAGYLPGSGAIKVNATDIHGNKATAVSGTGTQAGLTLNVAATNDNVNDPPYLVPDPNVTGALHQKVSLPIKARDLEFDYLTTNAAALSNPANATLTQTGNVATVTPSAGDPIGSFTAGLSVYQPFTSTERSPAQDFTAVTVGLGSGKLTGMPALFAAAPGNAVSSSTASPIGAASPASTFGSFLTSNPLTTSTNYVATINWGDASALATGTGAVHVAQSPYLPTTYYVNGPSHTYSKPGIYPINVTVTDTNGGVITLNNIANVSAGPIYPFGRTFAAPAGLANGLVATFVDNTANVTADSYDAVIVWGDGAWTYGTIRGSGGNFQVYGRHQYKAGTTYPVDVTVTNNMSFVSGYAWSTADCSGVATRQPPFAQSHIVGQLGNPGYSSDFLDEEVTLFNSGNLPSGVITLKFYLSPTAATDPISSSAIQLQVGKNSSYQTPSIPAGGAVAGSVSDILIPTGAVTRGHYLIMQVITSDPIGSYEDYPREFADPDPLIE